MLEPQHVSDLMQEGGEQIDLIIARCRPVQRPVLLPIQVNHTRLGRLGKKRMPQHTVRTLKRICVAVITGLETDIDQRLAGHLLEGQRGTLRPGCKRPPGRVLLLRPLELCQRIDQSPGELRGFPANQGMARTQPGELGRRR
jgi:hypothetical protein